MLDRTLKGIGVVEASPIYDSLPGFERSVCCSILQSQSAALTTYILKLILNSTDPKGISDVAPIHPVDAISPGRLLKSEYCTLNPRFC